MTPRQGDNPNERRGRQSSGSENQGQPYQQPTRQTGQQGQQGQHTSQGTHQQSSQRHQSTQYQQPSPQQQHGARQSGHTQQPQMGSSQQSRMGTPQQSQMGSQTAPPQRSSQHQQGGGHASQQGGTYQQSAPQQTRGQGMGTQQRSQQSGRQSPRQQSRSQPQQGGGMGTTPQSTGQGMGTQQMRSQQMGARQTGTQAGPGGVQMRPITIEDIVETEVVTAETDTPIATVITKMAEHDVGSVVIVEDDNPVGIVTDREIALALEDTPDIAEQQAGDLVSGDLVTATTSMTVFDALRRMSDEKVRRLPIVDDDGELQGIISLDDILVLLGNELNRVGETIQAQSPRL